MITMMTYCCFPEEKLKRFRVKVPTENEVHFFIKKEKLVTKVMMRRGSIRKAFKLRMLISYWNHLPRRVLWLRDLS